MARHSLGSAACSLAAPAEPSGIFTAPFSINHEHANRRLRLFTAARRFVELEDAETRGIDPPDFVPLARRTYKDSLHEWGLMDAEGRVLKAYEYDPEPLLGYVVRVNDVYAYGIVKQTALAEGTITPTGACDRALEWHSRGNEFDPRQLHKSPTVRQSVTIGRAVRGNGRGTIVLSPKGRSDRLARLRIAS